MKPAVRGAARNPRAQKIAAATKMVDTMLALAKGEHATAQFQIADGRSPSEVARVLETLGYEPVWKDWDAAMRAEMAEI